MNEWPTFVRTGTPPCSRITSGTAREQIRLCRTVAPGCAAQHGGGEDRRRRRAGQADARARRRRTRGRRRRRRPARRRSRRPCTRARRSRWLAGCSGSAGWFGNVPSSSPYITSSSIGGRRSNTAGTTRPPIPLAVSATTRSGRSVADVDERQHVVDELGQQVAPRRRARPRRRRRGPWPSSTVLATALISPSPSMPTGRAPSRHNLTPLYSAGLCEAVNITPGRSRCPAAKYTRSDDARPMSTTSTPWLQHAVGEGVDERRARTGACRGRRAARSAPA